jgi:hypothetical protein
MMQARSSQKSLEGGDGHPLLFVKMIRISLQEIERAFDTISN